MDMLADPTAQMALAALGVVAVSAVTTVGVGDADAEAFRNEAATAAAAAASQARARLALLRVVGKGMGFFAPQAKRALAACVLVLPMEPIEPGNDGLLTLSVEAFGSGKVIAPALRVDPDTTIGALRITVAKLCGVSTTRRIRLLVGHGGAEMKAEADALSLGAFAVADDATVVVVVDDYKPELVSVCV